MCVPGLEYTWCVAGSLQFRELPPTQSARGLAWSILVMRPLVLESAGVLLSTPSTQRPCCNREGLGPGEVKRVTDQSGPEREWQVRSQPEHVNRIGLDGNGHEMAGTGMNRSLYRTQSPSSWIQRCGMKCCTQPQ